MAYNRFCHCGIVWLLSVIFLGSPHWVWRRLEASVSRVLCLLSCRHLSTSGLYSGPMRHSAFTPNTLSPLQVLSPRSGKPCKLRTLLSRRWPFKMDTSHRQNQAEILWTFPAFSVALGQPELKVQRYEIDHSEICDQAVLYIFTIFRNRRDRRPSTAPRVNAIDIDIAGRTVIFGVCYFAPRSSRQYPLKQPQRWSLDGDA
jgi:hypothetical protein